MKESVKVYDGTMLSQSFVYEIDRTFYYFLYKETNSRNQYRYHFRPHANQRKKSNLTLNHQKLLAKVYRIEDMVIGGRHDEVIEGNIQLSLF